MTFYNSNLKLFENLSKITFDEKSNRITYNSQSYSLCSTNVPEEIRKYCMIKFMPDTCLINPYYKITDFDLTIFQFDKENKKVIINDKTINIDAIVSDEIRNYCFNQICDMSSEKDICKDFIDTIKLGVGLSLNMELYNKITTFNHKLYMNRYIFMKYKDVNIESDIVKQLLHVYKPHTSILLDLIKDIIVTKNRMLLENILKNKEVNIKNVDYDKLKDFAINSNSNEIYDLLVIHQSLDYLSNDMYYNKLKI